MNMENHLEIKMLRLEQFDQKQQQQIANIIQFVTKIV